MKFLLFIILIISAALCYQCEGGVNPNQILNIEPVLVKKVINGQRYEIRNNNQTMYLLNLTGNSWEIGFAYGQLMKHEIRDVVTSYFRYFYDHAEQEVKLITKVPKFLQPIARSSVLALFRSILRLNEIVTSIYTPARFKEELSGIAAGAGVDRNALGELNMLPQYSKAGCSIFSAWGKATKNGHLLQLRALDWDTTAPIHNYPTLVVYHSTEAGSYPFVNVAWPGFVGSITGFSQNIGMSQKLRSQQTNQNQTRIGKPWNYAVRDVLQFTNTIDDAVRSLGYTDRTCSVFLGVGSKINNTFRLIQYSYKEFNVYDDQNFPYTDVHLQFDDVVFMPLHDYSPCFSNLVQQNYGQITSDWIMTQLAPLHKTGTTQLAVYDFQTKQLLIQYCRNGTYAYKRSGIRVNLSKFY